MEYAGVFPPASSDPTEPRRPEAHQAEFGGWSNYESVEDDLDVVFQLLREQDKKQHCRIIESQEEVLG